MSRSDAERGIFITFEGIEASGKSTQADRLASALGARAKLTREPGGTAMGKHVRSILLDQAAAPIPVAEALLFLADRAQHLHEVIRPALAAGRVVISDRYQDSSTAYQSVGRGVGALVPDVFARIGGLVPDLTVLLDLDVDIALARLRARGAANRLDTESAEFHRRVREAFLELANAEPKRFVVCDGAKDPSDVAETIVRNVRERFGDRL
jgi:dTMP kinase